MGIDRGEGREREREELVESRETLFANNRPRSRCTAGCTREGAISDDRGHRGRTHSPTPSSRTAGGRPRRGDAPRACSRGARWRAELAASRGARGGRPHRAPRPHLPLPPPSFPWLVSSPVGRAARQAGPAWSAPQRRRPTVGQCPRELKPPAPAPRSWRPRWCPRGRPALATASLVQGAARVGTPPAPTRAQALRTGARGAEGILAETAGDHFPPAPRARPRAPNSRVMLASARMLSRAAHGVVGRRAASSITAVRAREIIDRCASRGRVAPAPITRRRRARARVRVVPSPPTRIPHVVSCVCGVRLRAAAATQPWRWT